MTSPEQQPTSQPEKNPTDVGLDIAAAKKYLEEAYGPEKSSIVVDKSIPIENEPVEKAVEEKEKIELPKPSRKVDVKKMDREIEETTERLKEAESTKLPTPPEKVDAEKMKKEIDEVKERQKPTVEELTERIKKEKARQDAQIETAKNEIIDLARSINEVEEKKEIKTEIALYDKAKEVFEVATGESLEKTAKEKAKIEAEKEGLKIVAPDEYRKEKTQEMQERVQQKKRSEVIKERWDMLSAQEKEKYFSGAKDKNDPTAIDSARLKFATELTGKISAKIKELAGGKKGISISEDVLYELMKKGLKSEDIKKVGFFSKGAIEIPPLPLDKTDKRGPLIMTREFLAAMEVKVKKNIEEAAEEEIERKIIEGQKRWREKKQKHTREVIQETAAKYEAEKKSKVKPEKEHPSETTEGSKPFKKVGDIEKVMKRVEADVKAKRDLQKKIQELIKKIKQGKSLTLKDKTFLNRIDSAYRKEAEK